LLYLLELRFWTSRYYFHFSAKSSVCLFPPFFGCFSPNFSAQLCGKSHTIRPIFRHADRLLTKSKGGIWRGVSAQHNSRSNQILIQKRETPRLYWAGAPSPNNSLINPPPIVCQPYQIHRKQEEDSQSDSKSYQILPNPTNSMPILPNPTKSGSLQSFSKHLVQFVRDYIQFLQILATYRPIALLSVQIRPNSSDIACLLYSIGTNPDKSVQSGQNPVRFEQT
jgi:hypothetical protein